MKTPKILTTLVTCAALTMPPAFAGTPESEVAVGIAAATIKEGPMGENVPKWRAKVEADPKAKEMWAYSPAMDRWVPLVVKPAANPDRPTVYALKGGDGGEGRANWVMQSDILDFYADKDVNLVIPMSGAFSYHSDWVEEEPRLGGKQMWETFMTKELPQGIEQHLKANNQRAIFGMSMSATTVYNYAEHLPGFYNAIGSFSGCAQTAKDAGKLGVFATMARPGIPMEKMWGPLDGPLRHYNDGLENASKLRGPAMYISNASGLQGESDMPSHPTNHGNSLRVADLIIEGGGIEAVTNKCTHDLKAKLDREGIAADWAFRPVGTHSWPYWQQDLRGSWETFRVAFGM